MQASTATDSHAIAQDDKISTIKKEIEAKEREKNEVRRRYEGLIAAAQNSALALENAAKAMRHSAGSPIAASDSTAVSSFRSDTGAAANISSDADGNVGSDASASSMPPVEAKTTDAAVSVPMGSFQSFAKADLTPALTPPPDAGADTTLDSAFDTDNPFGSADF